MVFTVNNFPHRQLDRRKAQKSLLNSFLQELSLARDGFRRPLPGRPRGSGLRMGARLSPQSRVERSDFHFCEVYERTLGKYDCKVPALRMSAAMEAASEGIDAIE